LLYIYIFINDLSNIIINSEIFIFADDDKLIKVIKTQQDVINLQSDIDNLQIWCDMSHISLNINKCKFVHFYQIKIPINFQYTISNSNIEFVSQFKDLGIIVDTIFNFSFHSEIIRLCVLCVLSSVPKFHFRTLFI